MRAEEIAREELERRRQGGLLRRLRVIDGAQDTWVTVEGRRALLLCSNNYLGLANHPALIEAATRAATDVGVGSGASRLISGSMRLHHCLEEELAAWKSAEAALLFTSGYQANVGTITSLVGRGDAVFSDELNHASLIDGCRLSRAEVQVYPHLDIEALESQLAACRARRRLVVTDSIFSMDGDAAPLAAICEVAERHDAMVMVDEAHAAGVLGPAGEGLVAALGLSSRVAVQMGTLGKALGSFGAYVTGSRAVIDLLIQKARSFVYTTALPPPVVAASLAALAIVQTEPERRQRLADRAIFLAERLRSLGLPVGLPPGTPGGHILPVPLGEASRTMEVSTRLLDAGVFVQGIRPPTVPPGTSRLRLTVTSEHRLEDLETAVDALQRILAGEEHVETVP